MVAQVDFETELNIAPYMSNRRAEPQMYELYGVLVHAGHSVHSGHYYCFVRGPNGIWHHMDDTRVSQVRSPPNPDVMICYAEQP
jgi:ubiquitin carboxyl-terminal hydrolase 36/42